jgi:hypothetical protein
MILAITARNIWKGHLMTAVRRSSSSGHFLVILAFVVVSVIAVLGAAYFFWQQQQEQATRKELMSQVNELNTKVGQLQASPTSSALPTSVPSASPSPSQVPTPAPSPILTGTIQGKLSYPSEMLPKQSICAVNQATTLEICSEEYEGNTYKITVPAGTYQVYARVIGQPNGSKAYYSEFVTCGLKYGCPSHKPIDVVVKAGETVQNIDPGDWYAGQ